MAATLQKASLAHLETLAKIERECFTQEAYSKEQIAWLLEAPSSVSLLAKVEGEIVGFIIGLVEDHERINLGHIITIDVLPKHRRKGIGIMLLNAVEGTFRASGVDTCYLEVRADNAAARRLYAKAGYSQVAYLQDYYSRGGHGIRLEKSLLLK